MEHEALILDSGEKTSFSNLCPEVAYDIFGLFASELHPYADAQDREIAHKRLGNNGAPGDNWRWNWANVTLFHYSECRLYSVLVSEKTSEREKVEENEIIEIKPGWCGISIDLKEIWRRMCKKFKR